MNDDFDENAPLYGPARREGAYVVYEFAGLHERVPEMLELIATWLRTCAEYQLEQIALNTDELGWSSIAVTVQELRPGDLIEQLTQAGHDEMASIVATTVTEHGVREGLRLLGVNYR